jgi:hypothetical protein
MAGQASRFCKRCGAPVSSNARFCGQCGYDRTGTDSVSGVASEIRNAGAPSPYPPHADQRVVGSLDGPLGATIVFGILLIAAGLFFPSGAERVRQLTGLHLLVLALAAAYIIAHCVLLYRWWACLPPGWRQTSPGRAVGFGFIPFYCFYWWFIAYVGLANDLNRFIDQHSAQPERVPMWLPCASVIVKILRCVLCWVPILTSILAVANLILVIAFALSATRACKSVLVVTESEV